MINVLFVMSEVAAAGGAELALPDLLERLDRRRISSALLLMKGRFGLISMLRAALRQGRKADVIVGAMETLPTYLAWLVARLLRKPLACWIRADVELYLSALPAWHRWFARLIYPRCDAVALTTAGSMLSLERVARLRPENLHLIHSPVDISAFRRMAEKPIAKRYEPLFTKPFVLGIGSLKDDRQGFELLIRAHARLRSKGVDHNLVILGDGQDRPGLQQLARSLEVGDSVLLPGFQRNPFPYFKAASALAVPARLEGFSRISLEAMSLGLPVVGCPGSGPTEILQEGRYGIMVPAEDPESLSCALMLLLNDDGVHAHYSKLALQRAQEYDPAQIAVQWDELLCSVAGQRQ